MSVLFIVIAVCNLTLLGYYLGKSPDPVWYTLGRFLMATGGATLCGVMFQFMHTYEIRKSINQATKRGK